MNIKKIIEQWKNVVLMNSYYHGDNKSVGTFGLSGREVVYMEFKDNKIFLSHYSPISKDAHRDIIKKFVSKAKFAAFIYPENYYKIDGKWINSDKNDFIDSIRYLFNGMQIKNIEYSMLRRFGNNYQGLFWIYNGVPFFEGSKIKGEIE
jgi:hypothetical protein